MIHFSFHYFPKLIVLLRHLTAHYKLYHIAISKAAEHNLEIYTLNLLEAKIYKAGCYQIICHYHLLLRLQEKGKT